MPQNYEDLLDQELDNVANILPNHVPDGYELHDTRDAVDRYFAAQEALGDALTNGNVVDLYRRLDALIDDEVERLPQFASQQHQASMFPDFIITEENEDYDKGDYAAAVSVDSHKQVFLKDSGLDAAMEDFAEEWEDTTDLTVDHAGFTDPDYSNVYLNNL